MNTTENIIKETEAITTNQCCAKTDKLLKNFLEEHFDFDELNKVGFFDESIKKTDYKKQSERICEYFGLESIYQYGWNEIKTHISYVRERPKDAEFVEVFKPWHSS